MKVQTRPLLRRIIEIHNKIQNNTFPNTTTLARDLEMGTATISRDIDTMRYNLNAPIKYDANERGYYYAQDYELPFAKLTGEYANSLICAKVLLTSHKNSPFYDNLKNTLDNIIDPSLKNDASYLFNRIEVITGAEYPTAPVQNWKKIIQAICDNKILTFLYKSRRQAEDEKDLNRKICPYEIVFDRNNAYIFALDKKDGETKLFNISKIHDIRIVDEKFKLPKDYKFKEANGYGRFGAYISPRGKLKFEIKFKDSALKEINGKTFFDDQKTIKCDDGSVIMCFTSVQYELILKWVIGFAENAIPLEPADFFQQWKDYWSRTIKKMNEILDS